MNMILLVVGKTDAGCWNDALVEYRERLKHYVPFEVEEIPDLKNAKNLSEDEQRTQEGQMILKRLSKGDYCVLLDSRGREFDSVQFASYLEKRFMSSVRRLVFVIGGAYGFSDGVYAVGDERLSLSRMTFSHQMIRAVFAEQLYRAMTVIRGEKYHH
ncbi:MAG: 23S rRNA (pseudouridine(1915)-N(3))-methyltransferase RlmH [Tannerella sp.]|jgi:23S rRNA (pseudouridine1915-N3)-methyltransferase|nr:23S rRNA (pseudouridine(1915)-N(3))-methyltransferase RlmH [Tannerella sp.]